MDFTDGKRSTSCGTRLQQIWMDLDGVSWDVPSSVFIRCICALDTHVNSSGRGAKGDDGVRPPRADVGRFFRVCLTVGSYMVTQESARNLTRLSRAALNPRDACYRLIPGECSISFFLDDHGFSPLHWCAKEGHLKLAELLVTRGARINATNRGDDTPLHLASAHGHKEIVQLLLRNRADVNVTNEHGNTALHYACFWGDQAVAEELVAAGALVSIANKDGDTPLDKARGVVAKRLHDLAMEYGQDLKKIQFKDQSWLGLKTRSRDATLSRYKGISMADLSLHMHLASTPSGETWRGRWQNNDIVAKILNVRECTTRISRDFNEEFPKLRIFSHPNVLPVLGCVNQPPQLATVSQYMARGSLHRLLHGGTGVVVDTARALRLALDVARAMAFLHGLDRQNRCRFHLNSKHIMIDEDLTARVNMADAKFSFQEVGRIYEPAWMSPEALSKRPADINHEASDMWSFAVLLWELATREVPFADLSPMECGMKIALEDLRVSIPPGISPHLAKLIRICMNEDPGKRPSFDMVVPILDKMKR
ncbi:Integrin-linked protein kinase [Atta colombica]|uniref:Integrin-linked protein kinase n=1 Tax=Atta colombica TaxID=520822 RepID=A0A195BTC6_9HYME|nr:Integrin-linked protein kinase [Atta colombica]